MATHQTLTVALSCMWANVHTIHQADVYRDLETSVLHLRICVASCCICRRSMGEAARLLGKCYLPFWSVHALGASVACAISHSVLGRLSWSHHCRGWADDQSLPTLLTTYREGLVGATSQARSRSCNIVSHFHNGGYSPTSS